MPPEVYAAIRPQGPYSLYGIALTSAILTLTFTLSALAAVYTFRAYTASEPYEAFVIMGLEPCWPIGIYRPLSFVSMICSFHLLEFLATAQWNPRYADRNAFLLTGNGVVYWIAIGAGLVEGILNCFFPSLALESLLRPLLRGSWLEALVTPTLFCVALGVVFLGQLLRTIALKHGGESFTHRIAIKKEDQHVLVKDGVYRYIRHPSYAAFFWWALGTQLWLQNPFGLAAYTAVLYAFFKDRIDAEEALLSTDGFFGDDYRRYKKSTWSGVLGIA